MGDLRSSAMEEPYSPDSGFRVGTWVWAKIVGLPWWPAKVVLPQVAPEYVLKFRQDDRILVYFFGTKDYAWLPREALRPFQDSKEKFAVERPMKTHKKYFEQALREATRALQKQLEQQ